MDRFLCYELFDYLNGQILYQTPAYFISIQVILMIDLKIIIVINKTTTEVLQSEFF